MAETGSAQAGAAGGADEATETVRATSFLQRAVLRRRLRFLERRRELALHDLGGFVFESHRLGETRPELEAEKLAAIDAIDLELATLQHALDAREELAVLHEPGISSCPHCGTIHDSAANFCPGCGVPRRPGHGFVNGAVAAATATGGATTIEHHEAGATEVAVEPAAYAGEASASVAVEPEASSEARLAGAEGAGEPAPDTPAEVRAAAAPAEPEADAHATGHQAPAEAAPAEPGAGAHADEQP